MIALCKGALNGQIAITCACYIWRLAHRKSRSKRPLPCCCKQLCCQPSMRCAIWSIRLIHPRYFLSLYHFCTFHPMPTSSHHSPFIPNPPIRTSELHLFFT